MIVGHNRKGSKAVATGERRETAAVLEQTHGCMDRNVSQSYSHRRMQRDNSSRGGRCRNNRHIWVSKAREIEAVEPQLGRAREAGRGNKGEYSGSKAGRIIGGRSKKEICM